MNDSQDNATTKSLNESQDDEPGFTFSTDDDSSTNLTEALIVAQVYNENSTDNFTDPLSPIENFSIESLPPPEENTEV